MYRQFSVLFLLIVFSFSAFAAMPVQKLLQLIDYVGVDYREAIKDGQVINPEEYGEMQDFALAIQENIHQLSPIKQNLIEQASTLGALINSKASPNLVAELTTTMHQQIIADYGIQVVPNKVPDFKIAKQLYAQNCIACHGVKGAGDGPLSKTLQPLPTNFLDRDRYRERALYGLFSTVTQGVSGTSMPAFKQLTEHERWSLAFYVGQLAVQEKEAAAGSKLWESKDHHFVSTVDQLTTSSPAQLEASSGQDAVSTLAYLRRHPEALMSNKQSPLDFSIQELDASRQAYRAGDVDKAYDLAINAYLEGFELIENSLDAIDSELRREIEGEMTGYRNLIRKQKGEQAVNAAFITIKVLLETARSTLNETSLSGKTAFISAMVIILREGLEALLVVAALAAFLVKTGKREGLTYLYAGVVVALLMGGLTWVVSTTLIEIGGASRELTEGIAAITAAFVLFYVGERESKSQKGK